MQEAPSDEYDRYVQRCCRSSCAPVSRSEFEVLLRRLDDLYLADVDRVLSQEERRRLEELRHILREDREEFGELIVEQLEPETVEVRWVQPPTRTTRMGSPRPNSSSRREQWRLQRRRPGR